MSAENIHILGFSGSLRRESYNRALLRNAETLLPKETSLEIFDLAPIPLFNIDMEADGIPEAVVAFRERLAVADALLIATPEYNFSFSGVLKNAIDWASRRYDQDPSPLDDKPVAVMGAGGGMGTARAQLHLREVLLHNNLYVLGRPALAVPYAWEQFDQDGRLKDEKLRERLANLLTALRDWTRQLRK